MAKKSTKRIVSKKSKSVKKATKKKSSKKVVKRVAKKATKKKTTKRASKKLDENVNTAKIILSIAQDMFKNIELLEKVLKSVALLSEMVEAYEAKRGPKKKASKKVNATTEGVTIAPAVTVTTAAVSKETKTKKDSGSTACRYDDTNLPTVTKAQISQSLQDLAAAQGLEACEKILSDFGAGQVSDIKETEYVTVYSRVKDALTVPLKTDAPKTGNYDNVFG